MVWVGFVLLVLVLVAVDLRLSGRPGHGGMTSRQAAIWSIFWVMLSALFGLGVWAVKGTDSAVQFYTGYLLEKTLSVDNLFVFLLVFANLRVPPALQHRVLSWGIVGALILRAVLIFAGVELLHAWHPVMYIFGGFLVYSGVRTLIGREAPGAHVTDSGLVRLVQRLVPFTPEYEGGRLFTRRNGRRVGTMLLLAMVVIEATDVVFAVDSIPAILAVTDDPFIVFSSNILAILGLRALFFAVAALLERLRYLRHGLGVILVLIGAKMCLADFVAIPALVSFAATVAILGLTVLASLIAPRVTA
jgi:tellurite resistance protein TerC